MGNLIYFTPPRQVEEMVEEFTTPLHETKRLCRSIPPEDQYVVVEMLAYFPELTGECLVQLYEYCDGNVDTMWSDLRAIESSLAQSDYISDKVAEALRRPRVRFEQPDVPDYYAEK